MQYYRSVSCESCISRILSLPVRWPEHLFLVEHRQLTVSVSKHVVANILHSPMCLAFLLMLALLRLIRSEAVSLRARWGPMWL